MKQENSTTHNDSYFRYGMLVPLAFLMVSVISCCFSYTNAKRSIANDLNDAMFALANENRELWTRPDTIAALRKMQEITHQPIIYKVSDARFKNAALKEEAYFTLALVDKKNAFPKIRWNKIASDSIMLVPECASDGLTVQVQGFADCSMASVFNASDQTLPGILFSLSLLSMMGVYVWRREDYELPEIKSASVAAQVHPFDVIKLTPMQRQLAQMLLDAPDMRVDKRVLCKTLWGNKSNAEESLYTLVRRTKTALAKADIEIVCNRGDSYELHIKS